jgi:hypothetical protein
VGRGSVRAGVAVEPTTTTAGVEGTSAMVVEFDVYARPCYVNNVNTDAEVLFVKVNEDDCSSTDYHFRLAANTGQDVSLSSQVNVKSLSFYAAGNSPYDTVRVFGWNP